MSVDDLRASCDRNLEMILWPLINPAPVDLRPPRETGRRRARQRAPLSEVMAAYRVGFRFVWETLVVEAHERGRTSSEALVAAASALWVSHDEYTDAMATAYRETLTADLRHDERERTAMVEALLDGTVPGSSSIWEIAELLRLPASPDYVVVAAEVSDLAREALAGGRGPIDPQGHRFRLAASPGDAGRNRLPEDSGEARRPGRDPARDRTPDGSGSARRIPPWSTLPAHSGWPGWPWPRRARAP